MLSSTSAASRKVKTTDSVSGSSGRSGGGKAFKGVDHMFFSKMLYIYNITGYFVRMIAELFVL